MTLLPTRRAYELWAPNYAESGDNPLSRQAADLVARLLPAFAPGLVLDLGCGTGRHFAGLAAAGAEVIGMDFSAGMLRRAAALGPVLAADLRCLPLADGCAAGALVSLCLSHVPDPAPALGELARVLRPGAWAVIVDLHPDTMTLGWQRSFRGPTGERLAVSWVAHDLGQLHRTCLAAGFAVERLHCEGLRAEALGPGAPAAASHGNALYGLRLRRSNSGHAA